MATRQDAASTCGRFGRVAVEVEMVIPPDDLSEPCYEAETVQLLRDVAEHAARGDRDWIEKRGAVYELVVPRSGQKRRERAKSRIERLNAPKSDSCPIGIRYQHSRFVVKLSEKHWQSQWHPAHPTRLHSEVLHRPPSRCKM